MNECDVFNYQPIKSIDNDHGIMLVLPSLGGLSYHELQTLHHGSTAVHYDQSTGGSTMCYLRLENENATISWCRPNWSSLQGPGSSSTSLGPDYVFKGDDDGVLTPGLSFRYQSKLPFIDDVDEGYVSVGVVKEVAMTSCAAERAFVLRKYNLCDVSVEVCAVTLLYGTSMTENKQLEFIMPATTAQLWFVGLRKLHAASCVQKQRVADRRLQWLKKQYLNLYFEEGKCQGPTAADAIKVGTDTYSDIYVFQQGLATDFFLF